MLLEGKERSLQPRWQRFRARMGALAVLALILGTISLAGGPLPAVAQAPGGSASWLDSPLRGWNSAGMAVPAPSANQSGNDSRCAGQQRPAETADDRALTSAGWRLFGTYQSGWGDRVISAQSDEDGMCRPTGFQYFVFVNGSLAGTLSPVPMDSRTDGALSQVYITAGGDMLYAEFTRYTANDALCCPSSTTSVSYHINRSANGPVLVPDTADTTSNAQ